MSIWRSGLMVIGLSVSGLGLAYDDPEYDLLYDELYHSAQTAEEIALLDLIEEVDGFYEDAYLDGELSDEEQEVLENYLIELELAQEDLEDKFDDTLLEDYLEWLEDLLE